MAKRKKKASRSPGSGWIVFALGLLVLLVLFAIEYPKIKQALDKTDFIGLVSRRFAPSAQASPASPAPQGPASSPAPAPSSPAPDPAAPPQGSSSEKPGSAAQDQETARTVTLYFLKIEEDGLISTREVKRRIAPTESPLTDTIRTLLEGPSEAEIRTGLVSLIPRDTRLRGIVVRGSTAIVDFSEQFMYNRYGSEGFASQLKQIVYTATVFPSVQDVQILVEGKERDYLGGEGVFIGKPLSRNSF